MRISKRIVALNCCAAIAAAGALIWPSHSRAAADVPTALVMESGKKILRTFEALTTEHQRVYAQNGEVIVPMVPHLLSGKTRVSLNFHHLDFVSRDGDPVRVRITFHGFPDDLVNDIVVVVKADKGVLKDRNRSVPLRHGQEFDLAYGTGADRAYYLVARTPFDKSLLPTSGAYARISLVN